MAGPFNTITRKLLVTTCLIGIVNPAAAEESKAVILKVKPGPPAGFEELNEPQETMIDLFYGGLRVGSYRAVFTTEAIVFASPDDIISSISTIKPMAVPLIKQVLGNEMPTNAGAICGRQPKKGCGKIKPETVGVVFHEDRFAAELFIHPSLLLEQDTRTNKILPPAVEQFSGVHAFSGGITGASNASQNYSLLDNSTFSYGAARLNTQTTITNNIRRLTNISASMDRWGLENTVGFFNSFSPVLLSQVPMSGISVSTSLNTNLALRNTTGSRISLFLPRRSWVSIIFNDHIYSTDFYEAGNQVIDTTSLPEGSYEITLRIRTPDGTQTEERRFFSKSFELPPMDTPVYYGQIGRIRPFGQESGFLPSFGNELISTAGIRQRIDESTGFNSNLMFLKEDLYAEIGLFKVLPPNHQVQLSALFSSEQDYGVGLTYLGFSSDRRFAFTANARVLFEGNESPVFDITDPIIADTTQISANANYQIDDYTNLSFDVSYAKSGNLDAIYAYGPEIRHDFLRDKGQQLTLTAFSNQTQDGLVHGVFLQYSMRIDEWGLNSNGRLNTGSSAGTLHSADARISWNDDSTPGRLTIAGLEARNDNSGRSYIADFDHRGKLGNLRLFASQNRTGRGVQNFYSGNVTFSVAHTDEDVVLAGQQQLNSGFLVKDVGNTENIPMRVLINKADRTIFNTGASQAVFIAPYQTYDVALAPTDSASIDYNATPKRVTLYPGNIVPLVWDINKIFVVLGHVILPDGTPLKNAKLEQARNITVTDENGLFQGELLNLKDITFKISPKKVVKEDNYSEEHYQKNLRKAKSSYLTTEEQQDLIKELYLLEQEQTPLPEASDFMAQSTPECHKPDVESDIKSASEKALVKNDDNCSSNNPVATTQDTAAQSEPETQPVVLSSDADNEREQKGFRCSVSLPEVKALNGVMIYSEPLICNEITEIQETKPESLESKLILPSSETLKKIKQSFVPSRRKGKLDNAEVVKLFVDARKNVPEDTQADVTPAVYKKQMEKKYAKRIAPKPKRKPVIREEKTSKTIASIHSIPFINKDKGNKRRHSPKSHRRIEVQLGAYKSAVKAFYEKERILRSFSALSNRRVYIVKVNLGKLGIYYRLRASNFYSNDEARTFCNHLSAKGQSCFISIEEVNNINEPVLKIPEQVKHLDSDMSDSYMLPKPINAISSQ